jgi:hypothetical protein
VRRPGNRKDEAHIREGHQSPDSSVNPIHNLPHRQTHLEFSVTTHPLHQVRWGASRAASTEEKLEQMPTGSTLGKLRAALSVWESVGREARLESLTNLLADMRKGLDFLRSKGAFSGLCTGAT